MKRRVKRKDRRQYGEKRKKEEKNISKEKNYEIRRSK